MVATSRCRRNELEETQQVPPLRYAPVGMTILLEVEDFLLEVKDFLLEVEDFATEHPLPHKIVIPTGA
jgi:hypothetical protein